MTKIGTSQNGWDVYDETSHFTRVTVEGRGFWAANEDVAWLLADFTQRFHDTIESINLPVAEAPGYDDWSWNVRPIRGQTTGYSNHGSATAWDLNATRHPRGVHGTYSPSKRTLLRKLVDRYEGALRHGEFYLGTIDGMHVEVNVNRAKVAALVARLKEEEEEMAAPTIGEIRAMIREELTRDETVKVLARKLFAADVIGAPDSALKLNPDNKDWTARSYLNKIVENTNDDVPPPPAT